MRQRSIPWLSLALLIGVSLSSLSKHWQLVRFIPLVVIMVTTCAALGAIGARLAAENQNNAKTIVGSMLGAAGFLGLVVVLGWAGGVCAGWAFRSLGGG